MVLQILADPGQVAFHGKLMRLQQACRAHPRELQYLRRADGASRGRLRWLWRLRRWVDRCARHRHWHRVRRLLRVVGSFGDCPRCLAVCPVGDDYNRFLKDAHREIPEKTDITQQISPIEELQDLGWQFE